VRGVADVACGRVAYEHVPPGWEAVVRVAG
jgi:hypothetical protein